MNYIGIDEALDVSDAYAGNVVSVNEEHKNVRVKRKQSVGTRSGEPHFDVARISPIGVAIVAVALVGTLSLAQTTNLNELRCGVTSPQIDGTALLPDFEQIKDVDINQDWKDFLHGLEKPTGRFDVKHVNAVRDLWRTLSFRLGIGLPVPLTQTTDEAIQLAWENGRHYFDVEIYPDGSLEWFYRDRESGEVEGTEDERSMKPTNAFFNRLNLIT